MFIVVFNLLYTYASADDQVIMFFEVPVKANNDNNNNNNDNNNNDETCPARKLLFVSDVQNADMAVKHK